MAQTDKTPSLAKNATQVKDANQAKDMEEIKTQTLNLSKGQVLTLVLPVVNPEGLAVVKEYSSKAFPLGKQFGLQNLFNLKVKHSLISEIKPPVFSLFSWPDKSSENAFLAHPDWSEIKAMRPEGWHHLNIFNTELSEDVSMTFSSEYYYTAVIAWFDDKHPDDYQTYLRNIEPALNDVGGRFILKLPTPAFETHSNTYGQPGQITFVQWPDANGFKNLQKHPGYQKHTHLFNSGLRKFEFYGLVVN